MVEALALEIRQVELVGDETGGDVLRELRVTLDRRQRARTAAFVRDRILVADAEREVRVVIEEERRHVIVVDEEQHVGLLVREPLLHGLVALEDRRPHRVASACRCRARSRSSACARWRCRPRSWPLSATPDRTSWATFSTGITARGAQAVQSVAATHAASQHAQLPTHRLAFGPSITPAHERATSLGRATLGALGVVYGDIGTSPLYALKEATAVAGGAADRATVLGVLSLIFWSLFIVITLKYVVLILRSDNAGEGGILVAARARAAEARHDEPWATRFVRARGARHGAVLLRRHDHARDLRALSAVEGLELLNPSSSERCCRSRW